MMKTDFRRLFAILLILGALGTALYLQEPSAVSAQGAGGNYGGTANSLTSSPSTNPPALVPGGSLSLFVAAQPTPPQASIEVYLPLGNPAIAPSVSVELFFSGAPGAFEVDLQEADTDADGFFITPTTSTAYKITTVSSNQVARADLSPTGGRYLRCLLVSRTNAVNLTVKITRIN